MRVTEYVKNASRMNSKVAVFCGSLALICNNGIIEKFFLTLWCLLFQALLLQVLNAVRCCAMLS